ncbi:hypothetical protein L1987_70958 [Smallanthus sonchifolius]|uniref:Uncharacterized protein n=1 Tax=Smallanthus sonchifolius TaxID=185202 RepID=A0ACB9AQB8_9ASTR|nr:hypothetical protein L1987_70958 [Smallanthus sonchifolius]
MEGYRDTRMDSIGVEKPPDKGGATPLRGISLKVTNIDGNPLLPRRGLYSTSKGSILDGLRDISKPVGEPTVNPANNQSNKSCPIYSDGMHNASYQAESSTNVVREPLSFAKVVQINKEAVKVNFRTMESSEVIDGADVVIPLSSVKQVNDRYANTLFGYFLGKRLAFLVVDYFVKNNWVKYCLSRLMMNAKGFFFFKFKTKKGMDQLLEDGPWMIRNVPIILNEWSPSATVEKEDIKSIPVWVKMHDVPLAAFTEDGLSRLASKMGVPKVLDSYTVTMCAESWGRSSFARALIEVHADFDLKKNVTVAIPTLDGNGYSKAEIKIEYDWEPLRCSSCCIFGHNDSACPRKPKPGVNAESVRNPDDFEEVVAKNKKGNNQGLLMKNQKPKFVYRPVVKNKPKSGDREPTTTKVSTSNSFDALKDDGGNQDEATGGRVEQKATLKSKGNRGEAG